MSKKTKENKNKKPSELEGLKKRIKELEAKNAEYEDRIMRLKAEFDNYKKRIIKEQGLAVKYAAENMVHQLLPIVDNLARALDANDSKEELQSIIDGVKLTHKDIGDLLEKHLVCEINPVNIPFDPKEHEAVAVVESDNHDEDCIVEVFQKGYKMADKVIRPAKVSICKKKQTTDDKH